MKNPIGLFLIERTDNSSWQQVLAAAAFCCFPQASTVASETQSNDLSSFGNGSSLADILQSFGHYYFYPAFSPLKREFPQPPRPAVRLEVSANVSSRHFLPVVGLYAACLSDCLSLCVCVCVRVRACAQAVESASRVSEQT